MLKERGRVSGNEKTSLRIDFGRQNSEVRRQNEEEIKKIFNFLYSDF